MAILTFNRKVYFVPDIYLSFIWACIIYYTTKRIVLALYNNKKKKVSELNSSNSHIEIRGGANPSAEQIAKCIESEGAYKIINAELIHKIRYILQRLGKKRPLVITLNILLAEVTGL